MSTPTPYSTGHTVFDHAAGRFRVNVYRRSPDGILELVGAGYGDTRELAAANAKHVVIVRERVDATRLMAGSN